MSIYSLGMRGLVYLKMGRYSESIANYNAALQCGGPVYFRAMALFGRGVAERDQGLPLGGKTDISCRRKIGIVYRPRDGTVRHPMMLLLR